MQPSARGLGVALTTNTNRRKSAAGQPRPVAQYGSEDRANHLRRKTEAIGSSEAARALQLMQIDPQTTESGRAAETPRLSLFFSGFDNTEWTAPELQIAAGPRHLLATVNNELAVFDKTGCRLCRCDLASLFSPLIDAATIGTPRVIYDQFRNGWTVAASARGEEGRRSWFLLATSQGSNPLGEWWIWALDAGQDGGARTGHAADWLGLSVDPTSLYLTANMYGGQGQFLYSKMRVLNKKELETGAVLHGWDFWDLRNVDGSPAFSVQPAVNLRAAGVQYLLNALDNGQGLTLWSFSQPPRQAPTLSRRFVPTAAYQMAPNARQPRSNVRIDTGDARLGSVVFRHGQLYAAHTIAANWGEDENVAAIQWFQINPRAGCLLQQGIYGAPQASYFAPAVMVDGEGNMAMAFNRAGTTESPSIRFTGRRASEEKNQLQASGQLNRGASSNQADWARFCSAAVSPHDPEIWLLGQYAPTEEDWATWVGAVTFSQLEEEMVGAFGKRELFSRP
ncbi:MAG: hypothetical protein SF339_18485 [Blastocatellia bacterium]|nr:hypothetical protein [Blastocatellia bacterium]